MTDVARLDVLARCEVCEKRIEGKPITDPDEGTDFCVWCAAALLAAQRNELANQLAGAVEALRELAEYEWGDSDYGAAGVMRLRARAALRRLGGQ
jgi:hypothetical protein